MRYDRKIILSLAVAAMAFLAAGDHGNSGVIGEASAAARAPELPKKKRSGLFKWPRVRSAPSRPESRPEDDKGRFMTKRRICRTVSGRRVCYDTYRIRSKRGRSFMIEREDIWRR